MPRTVREHVQQALWWALMDPFFFFGRRLITWFRRVFLSWERQDFALGWLTPGRTTPNFVSHLESHGFRNFRGSWQDPGQIANLRRRDGFHHQYHIRIFEDGEVRAHYEFTPEAHPILHLFGQDVVPRRMEFAAMFGDWVIVGDQSIRKS